jgi:hypothetical protein
VLKAARHPRATSAGVHPGRKLAPSPTYLCQSATYPTYCLQGQRAPPRTPAMERASAIDGINNVKLLVSPSSSSSYARIFNCYYAPRTYCCTANSISNFLFYFLFRVTWVFEGLKRSWSAGCMRTCDANPRSTCVVSVGSGRGVAVAGRSRSLLGCSIFGYGFGLGFVHVSCMSSSLDFSLFALLCSTCAYLCSLVHTCAVVLCNDEIT